MSMESFRFLHASDFHLDQAPGGITELQDGLIDHLIEATYKAVDSVFDTAIRERVDFVLLSGDIIHFPTASPRAIEFLSAQFERLHEKKIPTYWLGGDLEAGASLPTDFHLPKSVHRMATSRVQTLELKKERNTIAYIVGQSSGGHGYANLEEMRVPRDGRFFVGMWYCHQPPEQLDTDMLDDLGIDYWAFGGNHKQQTLQTIIPAHFCGTPQARMPSETGPHGCMLVKVTGDQIDDALFVETDALRYRTERIDVALADDRQQLISKIKSRMQTIRHDVEVHKPLLVTWEIIDDGPLGKQLRDPTEVDAFLEQIRRETRDAASKNTFTIGLRSTRGNAPAHLFEEDTIVGDFLRVVRELDSSADPIIDIQSYLPDTPTARKLAETLQHETPATRKQLLREVTTMGIDMLSGEKP